MGSAGYAGILQGYDARIPAPIFVTGSKGAGGMQRQTLTYAAAIAFEFALGASGIFVITDNVAFVLGAPTLNGVAFGSLASSVRTALAGIVIRVTYQNAAGVAHGAGTFNAAFKTSGNFAAVATGFHRTLEFLWNGVNWDEQWRTAADVAN
jgi:hypothetical protein